MILLQTLSRLHVCATLALAQVIGSICVMVARATAPNRVGPGTVFPDASKWDFSEGLKGKQRLALLVGRHAQLFMRLQEAQWRPLPSG